MYARVLSYMSCSTIACFANQLCAYMCLHVPHYAACHRHCDAVFLPVLFFFFFSFLRCSCSSLILYLSPVRLHLLWVEVAVMVLPLVQCHVDFLPHYRRLGLTCLRWYRITPQASRLLFVSVLLCAKAMVWLYGLQCCLIGCFGPSRNFSTTNRFTEIEHADVCGAHTINPRDFHIFIEYTSR